MPSFGWSPLRFENKNTDWNVVKDLMINKSKAENNQEYQNKVKLQRAKQNIVQNYVQKVEKPFSTNEALLKLYIHHEKSVNHSKWDFDDGTPSTLIGKSLRNQRNEKIWNDIFSVRSLQSIQKEVTK